MGKGEVILILIRKKRKGLEPYPTLLQNS